MTLSFTTLDSGPRKGDLAIVNVHPEAGEAAILDWYVPFRPRSKTIQSIALVHGLNPAKSVLILAGTTTLARKPRSSSSVSRTRLEDCCDDSKFRAAARPETI